MSRRFLPIAALLAVIAAGPAAAQTIAIVNARVETASAAGAIPNGVVLIQDGRIAAVGAAVPVPAGAQVIDARGGVVTPGLIAPSTSLGLSEIEQVISTQDDRAGQAVSAGFDVQYGLNPASTMIPLARQTGLTRAAVTPVLGRGGDDGPEPGGERDPGLFSGQAALVRLAAGDPDPVIRARVAVALDLGEAGAANARGSRGSAMVLVKSALDDARSYARNRSGFEQGAARPYGLSRIDLEALIPVVEGRTPLLVRVHRASDIRQVLKLAREEKVKLILQGAEEGWLAAAEIAQAGAPVLVDTQAALPTQFETLGARLDNAARLHAAGVLIAIEGSRDFNNLRQQRFNAGTAVAHGLPYAAALAAVTANPARIWGMADAGSLEVGKAADLVVWNGDPLETTTWPLAVIVAGKPQPMTSRAMQLRDRYMAPDQDLPPAYH